MAKDFLTFIEFQFSWLCFVMTKIASEKLYCNTNMLVFLKLGYRKNASAFNICVNCEFSTSSINLILLRLH